MEDAKPLSTHPRPFDTQDNEGCPNPTGVPAPPSPTDSDYGYYCNQMHWFEKFGWPKGGLLEKGLLTANSGVGSSSEKPVSLDPKKWNTHLPSTRCQPKNTRIKQCRLPP